MSVVLAEAVERAVGRVLAEANGHLEALVDQELDRRLSVLVADRLTANRSAIESQGRPRDPITEEIRHGAKFPAAKTCRGCGQEKPPDQYDAHRRVCKQCRRERVRANAARAASEADRPGADAQHD